MKNVVVLGSTGMLGSMVARRLGENPRLRVEALDRGVFDAERFVDGQQGAPAALRADYVINCVGVIKPFCKDNDPVGVVRAIKVNALFPHRLAVECRRHGARLIQIATDCVYSGARGKYVESDPHDALDVYGKTKSLGEVFDKSMLNIRCSIIGPELKNKVSLLEWVLAHPDGAQTNGFAHHAWNGVTTLQYAELCEHIIEQEAYERLLEASPLHHFVPNDAVTKYELLQIISEVYEKRLQVRKVSDVGPAVDRTLATTLPHLGELIRARSMRAALVDLRGYTHRVSSSHRQQAHR